MSDYALFVNEERTVMVRIWRTGEMEVAVREDRWVEVAVREDRWAIWGPPILVKEEK